MKELILAYQGEMTLKGLNRGKFEARLAKTIRWRLEPLGKFKVYQAQSTVFIEPKEDGLDMDEAFRRVSNVFGIVKLSRAVECPKDFAAICETAEAYLGETLRGIRTFNFFWHTVTDPEVPVQNSLLLAGALSAAGVRYEMHLYPRGVHGLSLATPEVDEPEKHRVADPHIAGWFGQCLEWLDILKTTKE